MGLSRTFIRESREPGKHRDQDNLYLVIPANRPAGGNWQFIYTLAGRARTIGLGGRGSDREVVRAEAAELRKLLAQKRDPREARAEAGREAEAQAQRQTTFAEAAEAFIASHEAGWRNRKHGKQWRATLETYAYPIMGGVAASAITTDHVLRVLEPIWRNRPETASRVRGRIEQIISYATVRGWRPNTLPNPAIWRGHLALTLPTKTKVRRVEHHAALDWRQAPAFLTKLRTCEGLGACALEFAIMTAARSGEVRLATWDEIDLEARVWTLSAERMKGHRPHRVPLSDAALAVLCRVEATRAIGSLIFPGMRAERPLSDMSLTAVLRRMQRGDLTVHGFRSTFRDWAAESTHHPNHVVEQALAHIIGDKVEAAYRRGDLFDKRRALMWDWAKYLAQPEAEVIKLAAAE